MQCPKCKKETCVLVTAKMEREPKSPRRGLLVRILLFPFTFAAWLFRILFKPGKRETYYKTQHWHCNYCNYDWPQNPEVSE